MSPRNRKYQRLEALFSEVEKVAPDSPLRAADARAVALPPPEQPAGGTATDAARFPRIRTLWEKLTGAHHSITDIGYRRQAQLTAALSLGMGVVPSLGFVMSIAIGRPRAFMLGLAVVAFIAYAAARSRSFQIGSLIFVLGTTVAGYVLALSNSATASTALLGILPLGMILGSLLLPVGWLAALSTVNFLLTFIVLNTFFPGYTRGFIDGGIILAISSLLVISVLYRNALESRRVAEVTDINKELRSFQTTLEQRVRDRTSDLALAAEVGRTVNEKAADVDEMLHEAVRMIGARFDLYYTQIYLLDPSGRELELRAGTGEVGKRLLQQRHTLPVGSGSLNGRAVARKTPVIVADTSLAAGFRPNPMLPHTRSEMCVPLIAADRAIGVLDMQSENPGALHEGNLPAFQVLAGQLAVAVQNANLLAESREARREIEESARRLTASGWSDFLDGIRRGKGLGFAFKQDKVTPVKDASRPPPENALRFPLVVSGETIGTLQAVGDGRGWTAQQTEIVHAASDQLARHIEGLRLLAQAQQYREEAEAAVRRLTREGWEAYQQAREEMADGYIFDLRKVEPLNGSDIDVSAATASRDLAVRNESIGRLAVNAAPVSEGTLEILDAVAGQLSGHLENLRLLEQNEKRTHELEIVAQLSATASTVLDPDRLLQSIVDMARERFGVYHIHIYLSSEVEQELYLAAGAGEVGRKMVAEQHAIDLNAERSLVARAHRERRALIVNDVRAEPDFLPNPNLPETRSEMAVPLIAGENVLGVFDVQSDRAGGFTEEDANIYATLAAQVAIALQNARLYKEQAGTVERLRELDRLKTSFLANMSHELRTPLNSILGFTDVMMEGIDGPLTDMMTNDLQLIRKNGQHLLHLINDVLDMAKISAGKLDLNLKRFKVHEVLEEVLAIAGSLATEKKLQLAIEKDSDRTVEVYADRTRLRQVILNLVGNSVKFTDHGGVNIRAERKGDSLLIRVADTGMGIPSDKLEQIFQEFSQVDTSATRKVGGTGLGLPISRSLVQMHGGRMWAESTGVDGEGSRFFAE